MSLKIVCVKKEIISEEDMYDANEAKLYDGHEIKPDLVLGPEVFQPQYAVDEEKFLQGLFKPHRVKKERKQSYDEVPINGTSGEEYPVEDPLACKTQMDPKTKNCSSKIKLLYVAHKQHCCKSCDKSFHDKSGLLNHSCIHAENQNSSKVEMNSDHSENHLKIRTVKMSKHTCEICRRHFSASCNLEIHMKTHERNKPLSCIHCKRNFKTKAGLISHVTYIHAEKKIYTCDHCEKEFSEEADLKSHTVRFHQKKEKLNNHKIIGSEKKPLPCPICKKMFSIRSGLDYHLLIHAGEKPFPCGSCDKQFRSKSSLEQHKRSHTEGNITPYSCHICQKQFKVKGGLNYHLRIHAGEKSFKCDVCDKLFRDKPHLAIHKRLHTEQNRYTCEICKKQLTHKSHLTYHMKTHTAETPFSCPFCEKQFALKSKLKVHVRLHTGERAFSCKTCGKECTDSSSLGKHEKIHLKDP